MDRRIRIALFVWEFTERLFKYVVNDLIKFKYTLFGFYYDRLIAQAQYLYERSDLYRKRCQKYGYLEAREMFSRDALSFVNLAKNEPLRIRFQLLVDGIFCREWRAYHMTD